MTPPQLAAWLAGVMAGWVEPAGPGDLARYQAIAADIITAAAEAPIYDGDQNVERTAITMAAVASMESLFAADVDAFQRRGDGGRAWGLMQVHLLPGQRCDTRLDCLRIGRDRVALSLGLCRRMPPPEQLSQFMTGRCMTNPESRWRHYRAAAAWRAWTRAAAGGGA